VRNKDQILLENLYNSILEAKVVMEDPKSLIGQIVDVHPAISGTPESDPMLYMAWSIKSLATGKVIHNTRILLLKDCTAIIDHDKVKNFQLSPNKGTKTPNLLVRGTVLDIDFDMSKISNILSNGDWKSITYNPHKHREYVYKDKLPEWWNTDERFPHDNPRIPDLTKKRLEASEERSKENFAYNELSKKDPNENISKFSCENILLKQYLKRGEDYMWVNGVL
jgi:hypothetical protein